MAAALASMLLFLGFVLQNRQRYVKKPCVREWPSAILYGPSTVEASFGGSQPRPPRGKVFVNPSQGVLLIASNLPPTPADKIYEMWLIPKGAKPIPAGLFQSYQRGGPAHTPGGGGSRLNGGCRGDRRKPGRRRSAHHNPLIVAALGTPVKG